MKKNLSAIREWSIPILLLWIAISANILAQRDDYWIRGSVCVTSRNDYPLGVVVKSFDSTVKVDSASVIKVNVDNFVNIRDPVRIDDRTGIQIKPYDSFGIKINSGPYNPIYVQTR